MRLSRQVIRFAGIGVVSTAAYVALYAVLRSYVPAQPANGVALVATAIGNTVANRRLTFGSDGRRTAWQDQAVGMLALGMALLITTGALDVLQALEPGSSRAVELAVLVAANALATAVRFLVLRAWMAPRPALARQPRVSPGAPAAPPG
jgi:putative flippase GtrA